MPIPTEQVGSMPRSTRLQSAIESYDAGSISHADLVAEQHNACAETIRLLEGTGSSIVSDGEQRKSSFATYALAETLGGKDMADKLAPGGQDFAIFADGHRRQLPKLGDGRFRYKTYAAEYVANARKTAVKPIKQAVIAPSMLALLYPLDDVVDGYDRETFETDLVEECTKDIRAAFAAGAARVSIDFTEGRLALRRDSANPWTGRGMLGHFIALNNRVLANFSAAERANIGIHTCPGGDCDSTHSADVDYADLLPSLFRINAGYFLIQASSEPDRKRTYKLIGQHIRRDANGVKQVALSESSTRSIRASKPPKKCATRCCSRPGTFRPTNSVRPTIAAFRHSASTRSPSTAHPTARATSPSARLQRASKERSSRRMRWVSSFEPGPGCRFSTS